MFPYNQTQDQISQLLMQGIQPQASNLHERQIKWAAKIKAKQEAYK